MCVYVCIRIFCIFYRSFERTTPIWFNKLIIKEDGIAEDFLDKKKQIFSSSSTHSILDILCMGERVDKENLAQHITFFKEYLCGLPPRLAEIYSVYRLFSHEVSKLKFHKGQILLNYTNI